MSDEQEPQEKGEEVEDEGIGIYVLPSEENMPPRAMLFRQIEGELPEELKAQLDEEAGMIQVVESTMVTWSNDSGTWLQMDGTPVSPDVGEAITQHAKDLGVDW